MKKAIALLPMILGLLLPSIAMAAPGSTGSSSAMMFAAVREATNKYHDVDAALADGYVPFGSCEEIPGVGTLGSHWPNLGLAFDLVVDELTPEILLYVDTQEGSRLVGVEYFMAAIGTNGTYVGPWFGMDLPAGWTWLTTAPTLFGRSMDGPMGPHELGVTPWHYDLHVWLWQANPNGIFEEINPAARC